MKKIVRVELDGGIVVTMPEKVDPIKLNAAFMMLAAFMWHDLIDVNHANKKVYRKIIDESVEIAKTGDFSSLARDCIFRALEEVSEA